MTNLRHTHGLGAAGSADRRRLSRRLARRHFMRLSAAGVAGVSMSGWFDALAARAADHPDRRRSCILLWMTGGPSQLDTFDLKPDHANGGPIKPIKTSVTGVAISEHLPQLAKLMKHASIIRSMNTIEGDHARATYFLRTGYVPSGAVQYPTMGSFLSKELGRERTLPNFVSIAPYRSLSPAAYGSGYLGSRYAPLTVGASGNQGQPQDDVLRALKVKNLKRPEQVDLPQAGARLALLKDLEADFLAHRADAGPVSHRTAYEQAVRMMRSEAMQVFDLDKEPAQLRDAYGRNLFGQGCLLARRLVESGVPFVEVGLNGVPGAQSLGWDTHQNNFETVKKLSAVLDPAWATLIKDLKDRGLLDSTLIVWMGEFGRTPKINQNTGRDHYPAAWSSVMCGGGIRGGQVVGRTSRDGMTIEERPVKVADLMMTICAALGIDPAKQNMSNVGRPIRLADPNGSPIKELLG